MTDKVKLALAILALLAGLTGFYLLSEQAMVLRVLSVIAGLLFCGLFSGKQPQDKSFNCLLVKRFLRFARLSGLLEKPFKPQRLFWFLVPMAFILYLTDKTSEWVMYDIILGWKNHEHALVRRSHAYSGL